MQRWKALLFVIAGLVVSGDLMAQPNNKGVPLITNYPFNITQGSEQNWCITKDLRGVMYFGNADKGVLEYDGEAWRNIPLPNSPIVRSLVTTDEGVVYVGAESEFGRLEPDNQGNMHYVSLSDTMDWNSIDFTRVWKTHYYDGKVYFCTLGNIYVYNTRSDDLIAIEAPKHAFFSYMINGQLFTGDYERGLMVYGELGFSAIPGGEYYAKNDISALVGVDTRNLMVGTYTDGISLLNTSTGVVNTDFVNSELNDYFRESIILHIHRVDNNFAVATRYGGLVIMDENGEAREIITEEEGILEQTITYVFSDEINKGTGPLWVTHFAGISKLETNNPFRLFTEDAGFDGLITDIREFEETLYVSTFSGLYFKDSRSTETKFVQIPEIQGLIWDLEQFNPDGRTSLLLASGQENIYVIDEQRNVVRLTDRILNPPVNNADWEVYGGEDIGLDPARRDIIYVGRAEILGLQYINGWWKEFIRYRNVPQEGYQKYSIDKYGYLWASSSDRVVRLDTAGQHYFRSFFEENGLPSSERNKVFIDQSNGEVLIGTIDGFYRYNYFRDTMTRDSLYNSVLPEGQNYIRDFYIDREGDFWFSFENEHLGWTEILARRGENGLEIIEDMAFQRLPDASVDIFHSDSQSGIWFSKSNQLYHFDKAFSRNDTLPFQTLIRRVVINGDSVIFSGTNFTSNGLGKLQTANGQSREIRPEIRHRYNNIEFRWAAPYFEQEDKLQYSYMLSGFDKEWSDWTDAVYKDYTNLNARVYTMKVKARNVYGLESVPAIYTFTIQRPWYGSIPAIIAYILLSGLLVYISIKLYTRRLKNENIRLEGIIMERTTEIRKQKEELTDSIEYASRIQRALLPSDRLMVENDIEHFILFRPRDIVSGDFYWMGSKKDKILIVAADCTGHGVPGAFMSMLGMTFLDEIVIKSEITSTEEILEQLRNHVITSLKQSGKSMEESTKDGMDLAMVSIEKKSGKIQFSGAYNPLYLVRKLKRSEKSKLKNGEELDLPRGSIHDEENILLQIRGDQMPIGISEKVQSFSSQTFKDEGFNIYMFSDGFLDQFGGPQGKKFMSKNFKKLILELQSVPLREQGAALEKVLLGWMGEISQIDDILVMGLRMNP